MINIEQLTIGEYFALAAQRYADNSFLVVPEHKQRHYYPDGLELSYSQAAQQVKSYQLTLSDAGYGHGHRIAVLLGNQPEMLLVKLALNSLGIVWVPLNPDYRPSEAAYILQDSNVDLAITVPSMMPQLRTAILACNNDLATGQLINDALNIPIARSDAPNQRRITPDSEASILYTSGTTGRPKGCILGHEYELMQGSWYCSRGGTFSLREGRERVYNPLPLFHVNAAIVHMFGTIVGGNCQIIPERFSRRRWWAEIRAAQATGMHYLGVVIPALMNDPASADDKNHTLRWGLGAGVEPTLHKAFEDRFGIPLIEVWGMTEMCRILTDCHEPRLINTRAIGKPQPGLEVRVVNADDADVQPGESGEMVVRHSENTPRRGAFSGYLNLPEATEDAWRGGWFHTGDVVRQDQNGMLYFVDRKKNIIRRSGENIAAAEVEACLQAHPNVDQVAVIAVKDDMRDEEVMACITVIQGEKDLPHARRLFEFAMTELTYYKAPGWIVFLDSIPVTGSQKIQKHIIFSKREDPTTHPNAYDFRHFKKR